MISKRLSLLFILPLILGIALYIVGCGDYESPVANGPSDTEPPIISVSDPPPLGDLNVLTRSVEEGYELMDPPGPEWGMNWVNASDGGEVNAGDVTVDIPPRAVIGAGVMVTIVIPDPSNFMFNLGPDGYQFQQDVTITVFLDDADLSGTNVTNIQFVTYDEHLGVWAEEGGTYDASDNSISVTTRHFSYWALAGD